MEIKIKKTQKNKINSGEFSGQGNCYAEASIKGMSFFGEGDTLQKAYCNLIKDIKNGCLNYFKEGLEETNSIIAEAEEYLKNKENK